MESVRFSKVLRSSYRNLREMLFDMDFGLRQVTQLDGRRLLLGTPPGDVLRPGSWRVVEAGLGRIVALYHRSSTLHRIY